MSERRLSPTVYLPSDMLLSVEAEARRLGRTIAWVLRRAWTEARAEIRAMPAPPAVEPPSGAL